MSPAGVQISIRVRKNLVGENFSGFVDDTKKEIKDTLRDAAKRAVEIVSAPPEKYSGEPVHEWASEAQRIFVMIQIALGELIVPRPRTGLYESSWTVEEYVNGFRIRSTYPAAKYMAGTATMPEKQASIHAGRWSPLRTAVETAIENLPADIEEQVSIAARRRSL